MRVAGFTFIRNAILYDYPIVEAIKSILPVCDEVVVAVGQSSDATLALIESIEPSKVRIIETVWDDSLRQGGAVLAQETNKALAAIQEADWTFYIQGDEVVPEQDLPAIRAAMGRWKDDMEVEGLLFKYRHFYGSYDYVGSSPQWYPYEIRIVRPGIGVYSYQDAQGFRKGNNQKLRVKEIDAHIHHYGWVKEPAAMQRKQEEFNKLWHDDAWVNENVKQADAFDYSENISALERFTGDHPAVMRKRIEEKNWQFSYDISFNRLTLKDKFKLFMRKYFKIEIGYKNYVRI
jgi:hypothetical protein